MESSAISGEIKLENPVMGEQPDQEQHEDIDEVEAPPRKPKPANSPYPLKSKYCQACNMPPEFCSYLLPKSRFESCWNWLLVNTPEMYPDIPKWLESKTKKNQKPKPQRSKPKPSQSDAKFIRWCEIPGFSHIKRTLLKHKHLPPSLIYQSKIKLHGTNASVTIQQGKAYAQRRNGFLFNPNTPQKKVEENASDDEDDAAKKAEKDVNYGFAPFVHAAEAYWVNLAPKEAKSTTIFGEWCGREIMSGASVCALPTRQFAVFCVVFDETHVMTDPKEIHAFLKLDTFPANAQFRKIDTVASRPIIVVPWGDIVFNFDFSYTLLPFQDPARTPKELELKKEVIRMDQLVNAIDKLDPFIKAEFGVEGVGEGIVCYPINLQPSSLYGFNGLFSKTDMELLIFKAKGKSHRVHKSDKSASIDPEVASSIDIYVEMFVTDQRCAQALEETKFKPTDLTWNQDNRRDFVKWISDDVKKEGAEELGELNEKQAEKAVKAAAGKWFEAKMLELGLCSSEI